MNDVAYKILSADEFADLQAGHFNGAPVDIADGYIHLSTALQVPGTVEKHFHGRTDLIIAAIDLKALGKKIRWEVSRGNALFPHLYGRLEAADVLAAIPLVRQPDGSVALP
jgi:uncharacterized protein (DUF952 family)